MNSRSRELLVLGDVGEDADRDLVGRHRVPVRREPLAVLVEHPQLHLGRDEHDRVAEAELGRELDRLR